MACIAVTNTAASSTSPAWWVGYATAQYAGGEKISAAAVAPTMYGAAGEA
jgi:hypothetical protein